ncbi:MAG: hypothetical protein ACKO96_03660, partial [Flammeovirgaceae bacterium]
MKNHFKKFRFAPPLGDWGAFRLWGLGCLLLLCLVASSCSLFSEPEPDLPPATQIGANTIGFKVNGKNWVPRNDAKLPPTPNTDNRGGRWREIGFATGFVQVDDNNRVKSSFDM